MTERDPEPIARVRYPAKVKRKPYAHKPRPRAPEDRVDGALHAHVINRDRMCIGILVRLLFKPEPVPWHQCRDKYGNAHEPTDLTKLTLDHFHHHAGGTKGDRATSDPEHLVAACAGLNDHGMTKDMRAAERRYMAWLMAKNAQ